MRSTLKLFSALGFVTVLVGACQTASNATDDAAVVQRSSAASPGKEVEIDLPSGLADETVHEIAAFVEAQGGIDQARVKLEKTTAGTNSLTLELWGSGVGAELAPALRQQFPVLASATIRELDLAAGGAPAPALDEVDIEGDDPETAKQKIIDHLRADGVEGDVHVEVSDDGAGRRVEVRVEKQEGE